PGEGADADDAVGGEGLLRELLVELREVGDVELEIGVSRVVLLEEAARVEREGLVRVEVRGHGWLSAVDDGMGHLVWFRRLTDGCEARHDIRIPSPTQVKEGPHLLRAAEGREILEA